MYVLLPGVRVPSAQLACMYDNKTQKLVLYKLDKQEEVRGEAASLVAKLLIKKDTNEIDSARRGRVAWPDCIYYDHVGSVGMNFHVYMQPPRIPPHRH